VAEAIELAWHVREGLLRLAGKNRSKASTRIVEDICLPRERLAQGTHDVQELLAKRGFIPGVAASFLSFRVDRKQHVALPREPRARGPG